MRPSWQPGSLSRQELMGILSDAIADLYGQHKVTPLGLRFTMGDVARAFWTGTGHNVSIKELPIPEPHRKDTSVR